MSILDIVLSIGILCSTTPDKCLVTEIDNNITLIEYCLASTDLPIKIGVMDLENPDNSTLLIIDTSCINA